MNWSKYNFIIKFNVFMTYLTSYHLKNAMDSICCKITKTDVAVFLCNVLIYIIGLEVFGVICTHSARYSVNTTYMLYNNPAKTATVSAFNCMLNYWSICVYSSFNAHSNSLYTWHGVSLILYYNDLKQTLTAKTWMLSIINKKWIKRQII